MATGFSGVFSNIDTDTLVARLMAIESQPLVLMQQKQQKLQQQQSAVGDLQSRFASLTSLLDKLADSNSLRSTSAVSSDTTVLTATSAGSAAEGTHTVVVNQLASAQRLVQTSGSQGLTDTIGSSKSQATTAASVADADAEWISAGDDGAVYTFSFGSETAFTITLAANTAYSMNQLAAAINAASQSAAGYDAAVVVEDEGQYRLKLTAENYGAAGTLTATLASGDAVAELDNAAGWTKTDGAGGSLVYTYGGVTRTITVGAGGTLQRLADLINNDGGNPGVSASVLQHDGAYHLVLAARQTGGDNTIAIDNLATTIVGLDSGDFTETQIARNAQIRVDGYPSNAWIERDSNSITDVIPGLTLQLRKAGTSEVAVSRNTGNLKTDLQNLVAIYNGLYDKLQTYTGYNADTKTGGILQGDSTIRDLLRQIRAALTSSPAGFSPANDAYTLAAQIGLQFDKHGQLSLDTSVLDEALADNYEAVLRLIGAVGSGQSSSGYIQFDSAAASTAGGAYEVQADYDGAGAISVARIRGQGEVAWRFMNISGNTLSGADGTAEAGLTLVLSSDGTPGAHTQSATVHVRQGLGNIMSRYADAVSDATTGVFARKKDQYTGMLSTLDKNMQTLQDRLEKTQARLKAQYARMEQALAQLDSQRQAFAAYTSSLSRSSS